MDRQIYTPLTLEDLKKLKVGDTVYVGPIEYYKSYPFELERETIDTIQEWLVSSIKMKLNFNKKFIIRQINKDIIYITKPNGDNQWFHILFFCKENRPGKWVWKYEI